MSEYSMIIERDSEGWYVGSVPQLQGCHTQARTIEELTERMKEAIELYLEEPHEAEQTEFIGVHRLLI